MSELINPTVGSIIRIVVDDITTPLSSIVKEGANPVMFGYIRTECFEPIVQPITRTIIRAIDERLTWSTWLT